MPEGKEDVEDMGPRGSFYGPLKVMCESAAEAAMPGRVTNIRPGFIVGPRDTSARFMYYPWRVSQGGEMLVPGTPADPIQVIDVRDLAEWAVDCIERKVFGIFNATGPATELTMKSFIDGIAMGVAAVGPVAGQSAQPITTYTWADYESLQAQGVSPGELPLCLPPTGESAGFHKRNIKKAIAAGLKFRTIDDTTQATLEWYRTLPDDVAAKMLPPGFTMDRERTVLAALKTRPELK